MVSVAMVMEFMMALPMMLLSFSIMSVIAHLSM
jgi:hypothetical protein